MGRRLRDRGRFLPHLSYLGWRHRRARSLATGVVAIAVALGVTVLAGLA